METIFVYYKTKIIIKIKNIKGGSKRNMATIELAVEGLISIKSEREVSSLLMGLNGVEEVEIDEGEVRVEYDDDFLEEDDIINAIEELGYSVID